MMRISVPVALLATVLGSSAEAQTGPWSLSFDAGAQIALGGDVHGSGSGAVLGLPTQVTAKSYGDVYGTGFAWTAGLGYRLGSGEIRVQGGYTSNPAERLQVGTVAGLPLFGLFEDYKAFNMDFGYRQYLGSNSQVRPFVAAGAGFVRLAAVTSEFSVPDAGVVLSGVEFLESSVVPAFGFGGGVQVDVAERFAIQGGIDFKWHGDAEDADAGLAGSGLEPINDRSRRWSMPVTGGITVKF
jgi:hypothetical protein